MENTEGLSSSDALRILKRVMGLSDLFILANSGSFSELEQEKNMPPGGILRQCLRLSKHSFFCKNRMDEYSSCCSDDSCCSQLYGISFSKI